MAKTNVIDFSRYGIPDPGPDLEITSLDMRMEPITAIDLTGSYYNIPGQASIRFEGQVFNYPPNLPPEYQIENAEIRMGSSYVTGSINLSSAYPTTTGTSGYYVSPGTWSTSGIPYTMTPSTPMKFDWKWELTTEPPAVTQEEIDEAIASIKRTIAGRAE